MLHCYFSKVQEMNINTNIYNVYALICKKNWKDFSSCKLFDTYHKIINCDEFMLRFAFMYV